MMTRSLLLLAILPAASAFSCSSGSHVQCTAVKNLESKIAIPEEHTAGGVPMCTPFGEKVYCLPQHDYPECQEGYASCCATLSTPSPYFDYPDHHSNFEHHDNITCSPEAIVLDDMDASLVAQKHFYEGALARYENYDYTDIILVPAECMIDAYNNNFHHDWAMNKGSATFSYIFDPPKDGCYMIEEHHPGQHAACSQHLPTNAILDVDYCKGLKTSYSVNQATNPSQWNEVGNLIFYKGFKGKLTLRNSNGEQCSSDTCYLTADAFRLTWIASRCPAAANSNGDADCGEAKEGTLVLGVESASSSEEVKSTLNRHQAKLEITLAAHLGYRLVDIVSTTLVTGRRLLVDSADEQSITTSRFEMPFSAKGSMDMKQPGNLVDFLNSALKTVAPGMKVVSADVNWQATADTQDTFKLICLIAAVVAVVVVTACVVTIGCLRRRKRQSPATKDDVDEEKQDVVQVTPAEGWNEDALVAGIKDSEKEEKTWETNSGSTQEPASEDTKSDASLVVIQERSATEVVPAAMSVGEIDV